MTSVFGTQLEHGQEVAAGDDLKELACFDELVPEVIVSAHQPLIEIAKSF